MKTETSIFLTDPAQNALPACEIEKLQLQLQMQLQQEQMKYRKAIEQDKVLEQVKPIRLKIKFCAKKDYLCVIVLIPFSKSIFW